MGKAIKELGEERREKVKRRLVARVPVKVIAAELEVTVRTIERDIEMLRRDEAFKLSKMTAEEFAVNYSMSLDEMERNAWWMFHAGEAKTYEKLQALATLRSCATQRLQMYQSVGILPPMPQNHLEVNVAQNVNLAQNTVILVTKLYPFVVSILDEKQKGMVEGFKKQLEAEIVV